jgi:pimeloyl-ACP methyl ester carboxylesterase
MMSSDVRRRPPRVVAFIAALLVVVFLAAGCAGRPQSSTTSLAGTQSVTFTTNDGVTLAGHVFGSGTRGVVLAHMYPADQTSWYAVAADLAARGYLVLTFDFRGYGTSTGTKQIDLIDRDVDAAYHEMLTLGAERVVLVGASMGGTASLIVAAQQPVAGVATFSAPLEFQGLSAVSSVPKVTAPMLFVGAQGDPGGPAAQELGRLATGTKQVKVFPGVDHGTALFSGASGPDVEALLLAFLAQTFGAGGSFGTTG